MRDDRLENLYESMICETGSFTPRPQQPQRPQQNPKPQTQRKTGDLGEPLLSKKYRTDKSSKEWYYTDDNNNVVRDEQGKYKVIKKENLGSLNPDLFILPVNWQGHEWMQVGEVFPELYSDDKIETGGFLSSIFNKGSSNWLYLDSENQLKRIHFNEFGPLIRKRLVNKHTKIRNKNTNNQWTTLLDYLRSPSQQDAPRSKHFLSMLKVNENKPSSWI